LRLSSAWQREGESTGECIRKGRRRQGRRDYHSAEEGEASETGNHVHKLLGG